MSRLPVPGITQQSVVKQPPIFPGTFPPPRPPIVVSGNNVRLTALRPLKELTALPNTPLVQESPVILVAGETRTFTVVFQGVTAVTSPSAIVYKGGADVSSTVMPSGSASASGNTATLKPLTALTAGETYVVAVTATCDGDTRIVKFVVFAADPKVP